MELSGRRVLITGASRGIGAVLADRFAAAGAVVALVARDGGALAALAGRLEGSAHPADLADRDTLRGLVARVEEEAGPVDVLVNNAGMDVTKDLADHTADEVERIVALNLVAPIELVRQILPRMRGRGAGHIVNVSSLAGVAAYPGFATYGATKAGLSHFTAQLRADMRRDPIGTTLVEIGGVGTDMLSSAKANPRTRRSYQRSYRTGMLVDITAEEVADSTVRAVARGARHVRLPRRTAALPLLAESPRRLVELLLTGV